MSGLLRSLKEHYGTRLELYIVDPRNVAALWDNIRFNVRPSRPAWILGRRKIFEGIPRIEELQNIIDAELQKKAPQSSSPS